MKPSRVALGFAASCLLPGLTGAALAQAPEPARRPNVVLIITDDQGHGDLGCHGNPWIRTPHLDRLAREGVELDRFYVSPVCAPTRASLLTGRYHYRTGVVDTTLGRALMRPDEVTLAEMLGAAGYRTGIFGKWHLGDNHPLRPMDQGFHESLVIKGGGLGQPSDLPGGNGYFDPVLLHNGRPEKARGYCSDVFAEAAMRFVDQNRDRPFFLYLAFNAPHTPLELPERYHAPYRTMDLAAGLPAIGRPPRGPVDADAAARVYGMVTNIDDHVGRLLAKLDELRPAGDTIVVFLTDNGPQEPRYNSGLRGLKGGAYEGGIRVPCFVRWPGRLTAGRKVDRIAAHIDVAPSLLEACGVGRPPGVALDGASLLPLLRGEREDAPDRTLHLQWHRGDEPELYRMFAARSQRWKLVQPLGAGAGPLRETPRFELYDMADDPYEMNDVAPRHPDVVERMRRRYEAWFRDVGAARGYAPPRIRLGTPHEDPVILTRQDWRGPRAGWGRDDLGHWEVEVAEAGDYAITLRFAGGAAGTAHVGLREAALDRPVAEGAVECAFGPVRMEAGPGRIEAWIATDGKTRGARVVEVTRGK